MARTAIRVAGKIDEVANGDDKDAKRRERVDADDPDAPVVITGICGRLGRRLARSLHRERTIIGIDRRPFRGKPKDIKHEAIDIRRKKTRDVIRAQPIAAVVHMGIMHNLRASATEHHTWNVLGFQKLLDSIAQYGVPKLIVLSGAAVYGPSPDNPQFLGEDAPLMGSARFSELRDLIEVDMLAQSFFWKHPEVETVILRPAHILGTVRNASSNYLRLPRVPTLMGFDPMVQVIHENDVIRAVRLALRPGVRGVFNLAGPSPVSLSRLIQLAGRPTISVPHPLAELALKRMWRFGMTSFPAAELEFIKFVCMVDTKRATEVLGFVPRYGLQETVDAVFQDE